MNHVQLLLKHGPLRVKGIPFKAHKTVISMVLTGALGKLFPAC